MPGSLPCTSKPSICQHPSEAVMDLECMYLWISSILCSDSTATDAISGPLYTYLYKYLHDFTLLHISTLIYALYFLLRYGLYGTTCLLSSRMPFFSTHLPSFHLLKFWVSISSKGFFHNSLGKFFVHFPSSMHRNFGLLVPHGPCIINVVTILCNSGNLL